MPCANYIDRLNTSLGIRGAVLFWIQSFITGRTQAVRFGDDQSAISSVLCGVPQGSVLGSVLLLLYMADVLNIIQRHRLRLVGHSYADDSSIYLHLDPALCCAQLLTVNACIDEISSRMFSNRLWVRLSSRPSSTSVRLLWPDVDIEVSDEVTCLGVVLDSTLTFAANVKKRAGSCLHQLRQLRAVRHTLSVDVAKTLVHALITTRVDYCNSVPYCMALPPPICVHFSQLSTRLRASSPGSANSTTSLTPCGTTCTGYQSVNTSNSSCAHWSASASAVRRRRTWPTCASQCRRHQAALICVLPFTVTSSFHGLAWPAMGLAVSPSRVQ